ncbi:MAG: AraC family transcriptional regulator [Sedimentisphaerales bacterium]|nr:AraC family transcriptional regulator [Sedimentisphaerales bacterium]
MPHSERIAYTEVFKQGTLFVEESLYYVFGDRTNPSVSANLAILNGGYEVYKPDFELKRNSVPYYVIEFPVSGRCYLQINESNYILERGVVAGYKPGDAHCYKCDPTDPFEHYFVNFCGYDAEYLFKNTGLQSNRIIKLDEYEYSKRLMVNILKTAFNKNLHSFELCNSYLKTFLLELCNQAYYSEQVDFISKSKYIGCIKYIDKNYLKILSVEDVANALVITPRYISKLFAKHGKTKAYQYITSLKMIKSSELLMTTMTPIKDIAAFVGYKNQYHFSRVFKNYYGLSPNNYRKNLGNTL